MVRSIRWRSLFMTLTLTGLIIVGVMPACGMELKELIKKVRPTVVLVLCQRYDGALVQGSGFLLSREGAVLTNAHVVEGADKINVIIKDIIYKAKIKRIGNSNKLDLALLTIQTPPKNITKALISRNIPELGEDVFVLSFPEAFNIGTDPTLSVGKISSNRVYSGFRILQISTPITHGSSGGPVFNMKGEVVGIATSGLGEADINFAIPIKYYEQIPIFKADSNIINEASASSPDELKKQNNKTLPYNFNDKYILKLLFTQKWSADDLLIQAGYFRDLKKKYPSEPFPSIYFAWRALYSRSKSSVSEVREDTRRELIEDLARASKYTDFQALIDYYRRPVPKGRSRDEIYQERKSHADFVFSRFTEVVQGIFPEAAPACNN